jgi:hypothetical protein
MHWLGTTAQAAEQAVEFSGFSLCASTHAADEYEVVVWGNGHSSLGTHTIGAFVALPTQTFTLDLVLTPRLAATQEPPRVYQPGVSVFSVQTEFTFAPLSFPTLRPLSGGFTITLPAEEGCERHCYGDAAGRSGQLPATVTSWAVGREQWLDTDGRPVQFSNSLFVWHVGFTGQITDCFCRGVGG